MTSHKAATREEWLAARNELLAREKELTRRGDQLAAERRALPWLPIEKEYRFGTDAGLRTGPAAYLSEAPVMNTYALDGETVYLTYSTTARGLEFMMGYYGFLDRAPLGRDEGDPPQPLWMRRHDEYDEANAT
jgi:predicted dithiol-disulfide oxidoreductase (DUF899 family)